MAFFVCTRGAVFSSFFLWFLFWWVVRHKPFWGWCQLYHVVERLWINLQHQMRWRYIRLVLLWFWCCPQSLLCLEQCIWILIKRRLSIESVQLIRDVRLISLYLQCRVFNVHSTFLMMPYGCVAKYWLILINKYINKHYETSRYFILN